MSLSASTEDAPLPSFPTLENEVDGLVANARVSFGLTKATRAAEHGEWLPAIQSLERLADRLGRFGVPVEAFREVLLGAAHYAVRGANISLIAPIFEAHATRAWPADERATMPWELQAAFDVADRRGHYDAGRDLGELVEALFPACPLGRFAASHFAERKMHLLGAPEDAAAIAAGFEQAARLADALDMEATRKRALLRAGALLLRSGVSRERGRELLRQVDPTDFERGDALWYGVGMAHSPFWLDRVRAADAILAVAEGDTEPARDTTDAVEYLLACAPIELQPLEVDRLEALAEALGAASGKLGLRSHLEGIASAPAADAGAAADILAQSFGDDATDEERARVAFCRALGALFSQAGDATLDKAAVERIAKAFPLAAAVLEVLEPVIQNDARKLATAIGELEGFFRKRGHALGAGDLKPVALLWPKLLPMVRELEDDEDVDTTTVRRIEASLQEIISRWISDAPTPGYGWWALAANLLASDLADDAATAARRALQDGESVDEDVESRVIAAVLDRAVRSGEPEEMLAWLEVAETRFSR